MRGFKAMQIFETLDYNVRIVRIQFDAISTADMEVIKALHERLWQYSPDPFAQ